jgi:hypothetical protein
MSQRIPLLSACSIFQQGPEHVPVANPRCEMCGRAPVYISPIEHILTLQERVLPTGRSGPQLRPATFITYTDLARTPSRAFVGETTFRRKCTRTRANTHKPTRDTHRKKHARTPAQRGTYTRRASIRTDVRAYPKSCTPPSFPFPSPSPLLTAFPPPALRLPPHLFPPPSSPLPALPPPPLPRPFATPPHPTRPVIPAQTAHPHFHSPSPLPPLLLREAPSNIRPVEMRGGGSWGVRGGWGEAGWGGKGKGQGGGYVRTYVGTVLRTYSCSGFLSNSDSCLLLRTDVLLRTLTHNSVVFLFLSLRAHGPLLTCSQRSKQSPKHQIV